MSSTHRFHAHWLDIEPERMTCPDTDGRLHRMIRTVAGYARQSGALEAGRMDAILATVERAMADGTYLAIAPQFVVTATA